MLFVWRRGLGLLIMRGSHFCKARIHIWADLVAMYMFSMMIVTSCTSQSNWFLPLYSAVSVGGPASIQRRVCGRTSLYTDPCLWVDQPLYRPVSVGGPASIQRRVCGRTNLTWLPWRTGRAPDKYSSQFNPFSFLWYQRLYHLVESLDRGPTLAPSGDCMSVWAKKHEISF